MRFYEFYNSLHLLNLQQAVTRCAEALLDEVVSMAALLVNADYHL